MQPDVNPDHADIGPAFPEWSWTAGDAILQPPKPEIRPSARVLERAAKCQPDLTDRGLGHPR
jgi:hypothetical protein